jgi:hypothetical protein
MSTGLNHWSRPDKPSPPQPFELEWVALSKREHIELVAQAKQYKSLYGRALGAWILTSIGTIPQHATTKLRVPC